jgi:hypothetical protein
VHEFQDFFGGHFFEIDFFGHDVPSINDWFLFP